MQTSMVPYSYCCRFTDLETGEVTPASWWGSPIANVERRSNNKMVAAVATALLSKDAWMDHVNKSNQDKQELHISGSSIEAEIGAPYYCRRHAAFAKL
jgi:hypothetical protein